MVVRLASTISAVQLLLPQKVWPFVKDADLVGSRVTCDPPPMDTDQDILVWAKFSRIRNLFNSGFSAELRKDGWQHSGNSKVPDRYTNAKADESFISFRKGDLNIIATPSQYFYRRFMAATHVAKNLNLMSKADRRMLFKAVLYGEPK